MTELPRANQRQISFTLNPEYKAQGSEFVTLLLKCQTCGQSYKVKKFATPPSTNFPKAEPKEEVIRNILNTVSMEHFSKQNCSGQFSYNEA